MRKITYWLVVISILATCGTYLRLDVSGWTAGRLAAIPAIVSWIFYRIETRRLRAWGPAVWAVILYFAYISLSLLWSVDIDLTLYGMSRLASNVVLVLLVWDMSLTRKEADGILQAYIFAFYIGFVSLVLNSFSGRTYGGDRFLVQGFDPNEEGLYVVQCIAMAWYLGTRAEPGNKIFRVFNMAYPAMALAACVLMATRGGFLLAIPNLLFVLFSFRRIPTAAIVAFIVGLAILVPLGTVGPLQPQFARLATSLTSAAGDGGNGRVETWQDGIDVFTKNPIGGTGFDTSPTMSLKYPGEHVNGLGLSTHSVYIGILQDLGLVGMSLWITLILCLVLPVRRLPKSMRTACWFSLFTFIFGSAQVPVMEAQTEWVYIGIMASWIWCYATSTVNEQEGPSSQLGPIPKTLAISK